MSSNKRFLTVLLSVVMLLVVLASSLYIAQESNHACIGENCPICLQLSLCRTLLKKSASASRAAVLLAAVRYLLYKAVPAFTTGCGVYTLVSLRVKLSN